MALAKPPVLEVAIEFRFDPHPEKNRWDMGTVEPFLQQFHDEFPVVEVIGAEELRIEKRSPTGAPKKITGKAYLDRVRARDADESRWLQVGNDLLVYNRVRKSDDYVGFDQICREAIDKLTRYVSHFRPLRVKSLSLIYVDQVEIPNDQTSNRLEDYLRLRVELPDEPFGPVAHFAMQVSFPRVEGRDAMTLTVRREPVSLADDVRYRFLMTWHSVCEGIETLDTEQITARLGIAHKHVGDCFAASFTEKGWSLFKPQPK